MHLLAVEPGIQPSMGTVSAAPGIIGITFEDRGVDGNYPGDGEPVGMAGDTLAGLF